MNHNDDKIVIFLFGLLFFIYVIIALYRMQPNPATVEIHLHQEAPSCLANEFFTPVHPSLF